MVRVAVTYCIYLWTYVICEILQSRGVHGVVGLCSSGFSSVLAMPRLILHYRLHLVLLIVTLEIELQVQILYSRLAFLVLTSVLEVRPKRIERTNCSSSVHNPRIPQTASWACRLPVKDVFILHSTVVSPQPCIERLQPMLQKDKLISVDNPLAYASHRRSHKNHVSWTKL
jgi:hypothetical protein